MDIIQLQTYAYILIAAPFIALLGTMAIMALLGLASILLNRKG